MVVALWRWRNRCRTAMDIQTLRCRPLLGVFRYRIAGCDLLGHRAGGLAFRQRGHGGTGGTGRDRRLALLVAATKADSGKIDLEAMVDYFETFGSAAPDYAQRAVGVDVTSIAGGTATLNLSSLDFSTTEPKAGTVTVSAGGVELDTETVDPSFPTPSTFDEIGRATVSFAIPAGATADTLFTITTPTGTVFWSAEAMKTSA